MSKPELVQSLFIIYEIYNFLVNTLLIGKLTFPSKNENPHGAPYVIHLGGRPLHTNVLTAGQAMGGVYPRTKKGQPM